MDDTFNKLFNSFLAGTVTNTLVYPLDVARIRTMFQKTDMGKPRSMFNGLWLTTLVGGMKGSITYGGQHLLKEKLVGDGFEDNKAQFMSGIGVGLLSGVLFNPLYVVRTRMQAIRTQYSATSHTKYVYQKYGFGGFTRGIIPLLMRDVGWASSYFTIYGYIKNQLDDTLDQKFDKQNVLLASVMAAPQSTLIAYPMDCMRLYRQHHKHDFSLMHGLKQSFRIDSHNFKSIMIGTFRTSISIVINHLIYLTLIND